MFKVVAKFSCSFAVYTPTGGDKCEQPHNYQKHHKQKKTTNAKWLKIDAYSKQTAIMLQGLIFAYF